MDMLKRMQKSKINKNEIPLLSLDIGGVTVKLAFFEIDSTAIQEQHQHENRLKLKTFFETFKEYLVNERVNNQIKVKNVSGNIHLYLFTRDIFTDKFLNHLIDLQLNEPFICLTGTALVNYMNFLSESLKSRLIILSSENEAFVRGIRLLQSQQTLSSFYSIDESESTITYNTGLLQEKEFYPSTIAIIGTSTTYLRLNSPNTYTFLQQSAISGQTFMGLVNTTNKIKENSNKSLSYSECLNLASKGSNEKLDVTVKKLCGGNDQKVEQFLYLHNTETGLYVRHDDYIKKYGNLSISCFGDSNNNEENSFNDFASASMNLVCYQIAEMLYLYSKLTVNNKHTFCTGSFLINNMQAKQLINKYFHIFNRKSSKSVHFIDYEASLAALGCLAVDEYNCVANPEG